MLSLLLQRPSSGADSARRMLQRLYREHSIGRISVRLWNGDVVGFGDVHDATIVFHDARTFRACFGSADPAQFARAYVDGRITVEGDLEAAIARILCLRRVEVGLGDRLRFASVLTMPAGPRTNRRDARHVQAHYDLSDAFVRLFLDEQMVYSCAYFATPEDDLEHAQARKLELGVPQARPA